MLSLAYWSETRREIWYSEILSLWGLIARKDMPGMWTSAWRPPWIPTRGSHGFHVLFFSRFSGFVMGHSMIWGYWRKKVVSLIRQGLAIFSFRIHMNLSPSGFVACAWWQWWPRASETYLRLTALYVRVDFAHRQLYYFSFHVAEKLFAARSLSMPLLHFLFIQPAFSH